MFIVYDDFTGKYLSCFDAKETAEAFKKRYMKTTGYDERNIHVLEVPYNADIKDVFVPTTYYVTIRNSAEATYTIEAYSEEEAEEKAYEMFNDGDDFTYTTEIIETCEEEE